MKKLTVLVVIAILATLLAPAAFAANEPVVWWDGVQSQGFNWGGPGLNRGYFTLPEQGNVEHPDYQGPPPGGGDPCLAIGMNTGGNCSFYQEHNKNLGDEVDISMFMDSGYLVLELYVDNIIMMECERAFVELNTNGNDSNFIRLSFDGQITKEKTWTTVAIKLSDDPWSTGGVFNPASVKGMRLWMNNYIEPLGDDLWETYATDRLYFRNIRFQDTATAPMPGRDTGGSGGGGSSSGGGSPSTSDSGIIIIAATLTVLSAAAFVTLRRKARV